MTQETEASELHEGDQAIIEYSVSKGGQLHTASVEGELVFVGNKIVRVRADDGRTVQIDREDIIGVAQPGEEEEEEEGEEEEGEEEEGEEEEGEEEEE